MSVQQDHPDILTIDIARIREDGLPLAVDIAPECLQLPAEEEATFADAFHVEGRLTKSAEQIYFHGQVRGVALQPCSRCVEEARSPFCVELYVVFLPSSSVHDEEENTTLADEIDVYVHNGLRLDLWPSVHDQILLALPLQPLCRPECAGLCQDCGCNLNETRCACQAEQRDPRFALLQRLSFPQSS